MKYAVTVDSSDYHIDIGERYEFGEFETEEEAVETAKAIVDKYLESIYEPEMTARLLYTNYSLHGWDPVIESREKSCDFLASNYAYERSREICGEPGAN